MSKQYPSIIYRTEQLDKLSDNLDREIKEVCLKYGVAQMAYVAIVETTEMQNGRRVTATYLGGDDFLRIPISQLITSMLSEKLSEASYPSGIKP